MVDSGLSQPPLIIISALIGLAIGAVVHAEVPTWMIEVPLMGLLLVLFLSVDPWRLKDAFGNRRFAVTALAINFVATPILSYVLASAFFADSLEMMMGLVMLLVTPCTDWYLVFTRLGGGNVELGMSLLPLNLILQVLLLPVYLSLFFGASSDMDAVPLLADMAVLLAVPLIAAVVIRTVTDGSEREELLDRRGDGIQLLLLCIAVFAMFESQGETAAGNLGMLVRMFAPLAIFFATAFALAGIAGRLQRFPREDTTALIFTSMARNSPLSLAIAIAAFPDMPLTALALVIGPLIELPVLTFTAWFVRKQASCIRCRLPVRPGRSS